MRSSHDDNILSNGMISVKIGPERGEAGEEAGEGVKIIIIKGAINLFGGAFDLNKINYHFKISSFNLSKNVIFEKFSDYQYFVQ